MFISFKALLKPFNTNPAMNAGMQPNLAKMTTFKTAQLRWLILGPSMAVILIMVVMLTTATYFPVQDVIDLTLILGVAGGGTLFTLFWLLTGKVGRLMEWQQEGMRNLSMRDDLTGLYNHVTFYTMLEDEITRAQRNESKVALLMLDLDHFKGINDIFGHATGDLVLKEFARVIHRQSRSIDKVCRFEGEEIAVILPETNAAGAMIAAERMIAAIEGHMFSLAEGQHHPVTISIGVATVPEHAATAHELVNAADQALNVAKARGRKQIYRYNS